MQLHILHDNIKNVKMCNYYYWGVWSNFQFSFYDGPIKVAHCKKNKIKLWDSP
jgi:hypothetical protein